jgi:hypothetical protein
VDGQRDHVVKVWGFQQVAATEEARRVVAGAAITGSRKEGIASSDKAGKIPCRGSVVAADDAAVRC